MTVEGTHKQQIDTLFDTNNTRWIQLVQRVRSTETGRSESVRRWMVDGEKEKNRISSRIERSMGIYIDRPGYQSVM